MRTIYKYEVSGIETVLTLRGEILCTGVQNGQIMVWAIHDDSLPERNMRVSVWGTGHSSIPEKGYLGTVFLDNAAFVFHVFAEPKP